MQRRARLTIADRKSTGETICSFAFTRDANGNILTSLREDDSCWYYDYDGLQRLTQAAWKDDQGASLYGYEYNYDKVGNRASLVANGVSTYYSYNEANELTDEVTLGGETVYYTYDGRGNQTHRSVLGGETLYFDYNSRNLITRIDSTEDGFTPNTFEYNALGQRIKKVDSTGSTRYVWDGLNIIAEYDEEGTIQRRYTHGHTPIHGVFSLISVQDAQGCRYCYHLDQVGGVHRLTDAWGNVIKSYEFSPFGRTLEDAGSAPNEFQFPATYLNLPDIQSLTLSPTRLYDATTGRFANRDFAGRLAGDYVLGYQNPRQYVDPRGLWTMRKTLTEYKRLYGDKEFKVVVSLLAEGIGGWKLKQGDFWCDDWDIDRKTKTIWIASTVWLGWERSDENAAKQLNEIIRSRVRGEELLRQRVWRYTKGGAKVVGGLAGIAVGGVLIKATGGTVIVIGAGALITTGAGTLAEGVGDIFYREGGINPVRELVGEAGWLGFGEKGEQVGEVGYDIADIVVNAWGLRTSVKTLGALERTRKVVSVVPGKWVVVGPANILPVQRIMAMPNKALK